MKKQEAYWTYKAPPTPELHDLPPGTFKGTEACWNSLTPGMRREIYRSNRDQAARDMARELEGQSTPDGAPYSFTTIRAAMRGMEV